MIINTGQRTDIPAFYSTWFYNRIREGYVLVRNPYNPEMVTRYELRPDVVDLIAFCSKNPAPMLDRIDELSAFRVLFQVTITPYGREIEPHVPPMDEVIDTVLELCRKIGGEHVMVRYDPIFVSDIYPVERHIEAFRHLCARLEGHVSRVVISFLDLYEKTRKNFPEGRTVSEQGRLRIGEAFGAIGKEFHMHLYTCLEGTDLVPFGFDASGCMTKELIEDVFQEELVIPGSARPKAREGCNCLLGADIGAYNTCCHGCRYCYATEEPALARENFRRHDPASPMLIGHLTPQDRVHEAKQQKWFTGQYRLFPGGSSF